MKIFAFLWKNTKFRDTIVQNCQLIKLNCQFDDIGNALSGIIIDKIVRVWAPTYDQLGRA